MKRCRILYLFLLICSLSVCAENENPFLKMISEPYAEYAAELYEYTKDIDRKDSLISYERLQQIKEVAHVAGNHRWELEARLFEISYRFREEYRDSPGNTYHTEDALQDIAAVSNEALRQGDTIVYLRTLRSIMNIYNNLLHNYELAFEYAWQLDEKMRKVDPYLFPDKPAIYREIAMMYYNFRDYDEAEVFFSRILEDKQAAIDMHLAQPAYNGLALIYRNRDNDLDKADGYFRHILTTPNAGPDSINYSRIWEGIAKGNLGYNQILRKNDAEALPLIEFSYNRAMEYKDYSYASGMSLLLARLSLEAGKLKQAKEYLDISHDLINRSPTQSKLWEFYHLQGKYYALIGDARMSILYADSSMQAKEENNAHFNALKLHRAEQRSHRMEQKLKEEELLAEQSRNRNYRTTLVIISVALILLTGLLIYSNILYRKRKAAYRKLVAKARQWAAESQIKEVSKSKLPLSEEADSAYFERLLILMEEKKAYLDTELSLESLADKLEINRSILSQLINQYSGSNFNHFVNDYRVKEAIRLLDDDRAANFSIDAIAFDCGFGSRSSFYRAFKKATGLTLTEYRNNKG